MLHKEQGLQVVCINSNAGAAPEDVRKHAAEFKIALPVLLDSEQRVADSLARAARLKSSYWTRSGSSATTVASTIVSATPIRTTSPAGGTWKLP